MQRGGWGSKVLISSCFSKGGDEHSFDETNKVHCHPLCVLVGSTIGINAAGPDVFIQTGLVYIDSCKQTLLEFR